MWRSSVVLALVLAAAQVAEAQFSFNFGGGGQNMPRIEAKMRQEPAVAVVGTPCHLVLSFNAGYSVQVQQVMGIDLESMETLGDQFEPHADNTYWLPVRFTAPCTNTLNVAIAGMQTVTSGKAGFSSSFSRNFSQRLPPFRLNVQALPETGKPLEFSGAVGTSFRMEQKLEPAQVRPGDLVTATYRLVFDGYLPSNAWPRVEHLSRDFKAYEPKLVERDDHSATWTQMLVPRTVAATNSALVSINYYNVGRRRYEVTRAWPKRLTFISAEAASTTSTSVTVAGEKESVAAERGAAASALVLHLAPAASSPVVCTLPVGVEVKELERANGWRKVETSRAAGWVRVEGMRR